MQQLCPHRLGFAALKLPYLHSRARSVAAATHQEGVLRHTLYAIEQHIESIGSGKLCCPFACGHDIIEILLPGYCLSHFRQVDKMTASETEFLFNIRQASLYKVVQLWVIFPFHIYDLVGGEAAVRNLLSFYLFCEMFHNIGSFPTNITTYYIKCKIQSAKIPLQALQGKIISRTVGGNLSLRQQQY